MTKCTCGVGLLLTIGPNNFPRQDPKIFSRQDTKIGDYPDFRSLNIGKAQGRRNLRLPVEKRAYVHTTDRHGELDICQSSNEIHHTRIARHTVCCHRPDPRNEDIRIFNFVNGGRGKGSSGLPDVVICPEDCTATSIFCSQFSPYSHHRSCTILDTESDGLSN